MGGNSTNHLLGSSPTQVAVRDLCCYVECASDVRVALVEEPWLGREHLEGGGDERMDLCGICQPFKQRSSECTVSTDAHDSAIRNSCLFDHRLAQLVAMGTHTFSLSLDYSSRVNEGSLLDRSSIGL